MNIKATDGVGTVSIALLSGLLIIVAAMVVVGPQEVTSQNVTDIFTLPSETGTQNQTQMALENLTRADMRRSQVH